MTRVHRIRSVVLLAGILVAGGSLEAQFIRGDVDSSTSVDIGDTTFLLAYFFTGGPAPADLDAADANDDNMVSMTDVHYINRFAFAGGPAPPAPHPAAGIDPTPGSAPASENCVIYRVGELSATIGAAVTVPVVMSYRPTIDNPFPVSAYFLAFEFEPAYLTLVSTDIAGTPASGYSTVTSSDGVDNVAGHGRLLVTLSNDPLVGLPPGEDIHIANLNFTVSATPPTPFHTVIQPIDTAFGPSVPNDVTVGVEALRPALVGGRLWITAPPSDPFTRGDFNSSGTADLGDVSAIANYLFVSGAAPSDLDRGDVNDDGMVSLADSLCLANFFFNGTPAALPPPHPIAGVDPTADSPPERSAGNSFRVCGDDFCTGTPTVLRIHMSNAVSVGGFVVSFSYDPTVFSISAAGVSFAPDIPIVHTVPLARADPSLGRVTISATFSAEAIPPGPDRPFLLLRVTPLAPARPFTRVCLEDFFHAPFIVNEILDDTSCEAVRPELIAGRFTVNACAPFIRGDFNGDSLVDATDTIAALSFITTGLPTPADRFAADVNDDGVFSVADPICLARFLFLGTDAPPSPFPAPGLDTTSSCPPPRPSCISFDVASASGPPGAVISLPVTLSYSALDPGNTPVTGYIAALQFDPLYLTFQSAAIPANILSMTPASSLVSTDPLRGYVRFLVLFDAAALPPVGIAPGTNIPIGVVNFTVNTPPPGLPQNTEVSFSDTLFSPILPNEIVVECESVRPRLGDGVVSITGGTFIRGDANGTTTVDNADFVQILSYLFRPGGRQLSNFDAADVNDDGMVSYLDALCLINYVFFGGPMPLPPFPGAGVDPTTPSLPPPVSPLDAFSIVDGDFCSGISTTIQVEMTNVAPADGFTVSIAYDPDIIDVSSVALAPGLPAPTPTTTPLFQVDPAAGRIVAAIDFTVPLPASASLPIIEITGTPIDFPTRFAYFCFRDGPVPGFVFNEIFNLSPSCTATRPTLNSGRFAAVTPFNRGDCNQDGLTDISDPIAMLICIFQDQKFFAEVCATCLDACDANDDEDFDLSDAIFELDFLFVGNVASLPPPVGVCGKDPTPAGSPPPMPFCSHSQCP